MRVAVVGLGAIGSALAAGLFVAGHEVTMCTRRPLNGLRVETPAGTVNVEGANLSDPVQATPLEWVLIATKTYDAAGTGEWLKRLCGPTTRVAVVQNGVEHRERFRPWVADEMLVPVIIDTPAERRPDGSVMMRTPLDMKVEGNAAGREFAALFASGECELVDDFTTAAWRKLCINATGVISAILLQPVRVMQEDMAGKAGIDLVRECVEVGRRMGAKLGDEVPEWVLKTDRRRPGEAVNSMLADRLAGKPTEVESRNGLVVRLGEQFGIPTPANRLAVALMRALEIKPE